MGHAVLVLIQNGHNGNTSFSPTLIPIIIVPWFNVVGRLEADFRARCQIFSKAVKTAQFIYLFFKILSSLNLFTLHQEKNIYSNEKGTLIITYTSLKRLKHCAHKTKVYIE